MRVLVEYATVMLGALFFAAAILNFIWFWQEVYPRNVPTAIAVPGCFIAFLWCLMYAAGVSVSRHS